MADFAGASVCSFLSHCTGQHRERGKSKEGKRSLHSRWSRAGQEDVGILSFSLWAEHRGTYRGWGICHLRPDTAVGAWWSEPWMRVHGRNSMSQPKKQSFKGLRHYFSVFNLEMWASPVCLSSLIVINHISNGCSHFLRRTHTVKALKKLTCMWIFRSGVPHFPFIFFFFLAYSWSAVLC